MARNNHIWVKGDLTGDIYYDIFTLDNKPTQYLRLYLMVKGVKGASAVKGLRICVYGPLAELTYGHVRKGSRIAIIGHIQTRQTKAGKPVFEIVAEEVEYLRNIEWETGTGGRDDLVKRGELRGSYSEEDVGGVGAFDMTGAGIPEDVLEDGSYTGAKFLSSVDERPGILPTIIKMGLPKITFASLQDIGLPLPQYNEEVVWLQMSDAMADQYHEQADGSLMGKPHPQDSLYRWAVEEIKDGTRGAISVWLNAALNRVNSMFRDEEVLFNRRISGRGKYAIRRPELVKTLDAVESNLVSPKDHWLASRCLAEREEGRKSIVFIRQTGKRNIQPHVAKVLQDSELRVGVLSPAVEPRRRMAWIEKHTPHLDVLLTNARLVRVGLNLRMYSTEIFYELEWSLAILWQAMRRVYRPGSPLPVRVMFPTYENTLEERAINLLGQKMKAAQLFYGDEISSSLCDEEDGDFLNDLVLSVLKGERLERATSTFATQNDMTASPLGSPTALSPQIASISARTWVEWMAARNVVAPNKGKSRKPAPGGQFSLWG